MTEFVMYTSSSEFVPVIDLQQVEGKITATTKDSVYPRNLEGFGDIHNATHIETLYLYNRKSLMKRIKWQSDHLKETPVDDLECLYVSKSSEGHIKIAEAILKYKYGEWEVFIPELDFSYDLNSEDVLVITLRNLDDLLRICRLKKFPAKTNISEEPMFKVGDKVHYKFNDTIVNGEVQYIFATNVVRVTFEKDFSLFDKKLPDYWYDFRYNGTMKSSLYFTCPTEYKNTQVLFPGHVDCIKEKFKDTYNKLVESVTTNPYANTELLNQMRDALQDPKNIKPIINREEIIMSRRTVNIELWDDDKSILNVEDALVAIFKDVPTEEDDATTIQQTIMDNDIKSVLAEYNKKRVKLVNQTILNNTGNEVKLQPVKLKDLRWWVK